MKNDVWDLIPRPKGKSVVTSKWIFKIKHAADGSVEKHKARFVAHGFSQKECIDYEETFALVARYTSIRAIISLTSVLGWRLHQMNVKTAFLNGVIDEEVYIEQPEGFTVHGSDTHVYRLKKALLDSSKHRELGNLGSTAISRDWASARVKQIPTFTLRLWEIFR